MRRTPVVRSFRPMEGGDAMEKQEWVLARDDDCPVCNGRCAFCDRPLEKVADARGYCRRCDVTYFARGCEPGYRSPAVRRAKARRR